jgi:hypothetical protein
MYGGNYRYITRVYPIQENFWESMGIMAILALITYVAYRLYNMER